MTRNVLTALVSVAVICFASATLGAPTGQERAEAAGRSLIGAPAPRFVLRTIDGQTIDLGKLYGKQAVYLKFWATWCVPCMQQMPHFEHAHEAAGPGLAVIAVNIGVNDTLDDVRKVIREKGLKMPVVIDDGRLAAAFNLRVTPQHVVIGRGGRIEYVGQLADEKLDAALRDAQLSPTKASEPAGAAAPAPIAHYEVGDALPDLSATTLDGHTFRTRDAREQRPTVLVFLVPWCEEYFKSSRPALSTSCRQVREQVATLARRENVRWLGVASGLWSTPDELREYETQNAPQIPLTMDESGDWFRAFDVMHAPTIVIADASGKIVKRVEGFDAGVGAEIERTLAD